ncbi:MAG: hypothetical protein ACLVJH_14055 [Faecalibacterium prausnitzii]
MKQCSSWKQLPRIPHRQALPRCASKPERFNTVIDPAQIAEVALGYQA